MESLEVHKATPSTTRPSKVIVAHQTGPEDLWGLLLPTQRQVVFQTIVQVCRLLAQRHESLEADDERA